MSLVLPYIAIKQQWEKMVFFLKLKKVVVCYQALVLFLLFRKRLSIDLQLKFARGIMILLTIVQFLIIFR